MKNTTLDLRTYSFRSDDKLFFDANIWLFIYGPQRDAHNPRVTQYSSAFSKALKNGCHIFIDDLILSEFINRYAHLEFSRIKQETSQDYRNFKQFRNSPYFPTIAAAIASELRRLFKHVKQVDNGFSSMDIQRIISEYENGKSDINDQIIAHLCQSKGLVLVTDDGDFKETGLTIATVNKKLLND